MTEPLTPQDCDCRGLPFMPLEVSRLIDSDLVALSTGDEFKAALLLWAKSWSQVPAASVPDDDRILARMAGYSLTEWAGLREMALRGWVRCSDGRLYHPVIADLAATAAAKRKGQAERANTRWAKVRAGKNASAMPRHEKPDATASKSDADAHAPAMQGTVEGIEPPIAPPGGHLELIADEPEVDEEQVAYEAWNAMARRCGLPVAKGLDAARRRAIRARLKDAGLEGWREALAGVEASAFLRGQRPGGDGRTMRADLAFVCQAKSFPRLREGFYGSDAKQAPTAIKAPPFPDAEIRAAVVVAMSEEAARSYIDRCRWRPEDRAILCPNPIAVEKLERGAPRLTRELGAKIILASAAERSAA